MSLQKTPRNSNLAKSIHIISFELTPVHSRFAFKVQHGQKLSTLPYEWTSTGLIVTTLNEFSIQLLLSGACQNVVIRCLCEAYHYEVEKKKQQQTIL